MSMFSEMNLGHSRSLAGAQKPGVIAVGPRYKFTGSWITDKPAIVTIVDGRRDDVRQGRPNWPDVGVLTKRGATLIIAHVMLASISSGFLRLDTHGEQKVAL
jgi:hypothetical protein